MSTQQKVREIWIDGRHFTAYPHTWPQPRDWQIYQIDCPDWPRVKRMGQVHQVSARRWQAQTRGCDERGKWSNNLDLGTWRTLRQAVVQLDAYEQADQAALAQLREDDASEKQREILVTIPPPATEAHGSDPIVLTLRRMAEPANGYLVFLPGSEITLGIATKIANGKWEANRIGAPKFFTATLAAAAREMAAIVFSPQNPAYAYLTDAAEEGEEERPEDAVTCPLCVTRSDHDECAMCGGRGWVDQDQVETHLDANRVPCVRCEGEGVAGGSPGAGTCPSCLGTGLMPVSLLDQFDLRDYTFDSQDWSDADLSDQNLSEVRFYDCNFSDVTFDGADLSNTTFEACRFRGANPERAASLAGTELLFAERSGELSEAQLASCVARGAIVTFEEEEPAGENR